MARYSVSSINLREALTSLKISLPEYDIRRLLSVTRDRLSAGDVAKLLRKIIAQYRIDPIKVLQIRGVGKKTYESIDALYREVEALETRKDQSVTSSMQSARNSLGNIRRRIPAEYHHQVDTVLEELGKLSVKFNNQMLKQGEGRE